MPTRNVGAWRPRETFLMMYGVNADRPVLTLIAFAARAGNPSWRIHRFSSGSR
jgi:hypothetical protein